ncbi:MAG: hypothetical protein ACYCXW_00005, partial [Solirubrobacteraceae bacterium]
IAWAAVAVVLAAGLGNHGTLLVGTVAAYTLGPNASSRCAQSRDRQSSARPSRRSWLLQCC